MDNVISLSDKRKAKAKEPDDSPKDESSPDFEAIAEANKRKADKLDKERQQANKSVLRSYRLKAKDPNNKR